MEGSMELVWGHRTTSGQDYEGCDGVEIQLLDELIDGKLGQYHYAEEVFDLDNLLQHNIKAVHAPLLSHLV